MYLISDPNEARVPVPDERFDWLCDHFKPPSKIPAFLHVMDIAGLVKGASEGLVRYDCYYSFYVLSLY